MLIFFFNVRTIISIISILSSISIFQKHLNMTKPTILLWVVLTDKRREVIKVKQIVKEIVHRPKMELRGRKWYCPTECCYCHEKCMVPNTVYRTGGPFYCWNCIMKYHELRILRKYKKRYKKWLKNVHC